VTGFLPMTRPGAAAEFAVAPAGVLVAAPAGIPLADAAAIPVAALTAWQALFEHGGLAAGQRVLVNGGLTAANGRARETLAGRAQDDFSDAASSTTKRRLKWPGSLYRKALC
jgi:hypothetical protein